MWKLPTILVGLTMDISDCRATRVRKLEATKAQRAPKRELIVIAQASHECSEPLRFQIGRSLQYPLESQFDVQDSATRDEGEATGRAQVQYPAVSNRKTTEKGEQHAKRKIDEAPNFCLCWVLA
jgi:hypothetical protein